MKQALLFCVLFLGGYAHALTINFAPSCTESYLDCYIDLSNGTYAESNGDKLWLQNDNIYVVRQNFLGWQIDARVSSNLGGALTIFAPEQFDRGYTWTGADFSWVGQTPDWDFYNGSKALQWGLWEGAIPTLSEPPDGHGLVTHVTWNVPDTDSTFVLLGLGLAGLAIVRRRKTARR